MKPADSNLFSNPGSRTLGRMTHGFPHQESVGIISRRYRRFWRNAISVSASLARTISIRPVSHERPSLVVFPRQVLCSLLPDERSHCSPHPPLPRIQQAGPASSRPGRYQKTAVRRPMLSTARLPAAGGRGSSVYRIRPADPDIVEHRQVSFLVSHAKHLRCRARTAEFRSALCRA
jgi:hypothetical protein